MWKRNKVIFIFVLLLGLCGCDKKLETYKIEIHTLGGLHDTVEITTDYLTIRDHIEHSGTTKFRVNDSLMYYFVDKIKIL